MDELLEIPIFLLSYVSRGLQKTKDNVCTELISQSRIRVNGEIETRTLRIVFPGDTVDVKVGDFWSHVPVFNSSKHCRVWALHKPLGMECAAVGNVVPISSLHTLKRRPCFKEWINDISTSAAITSGEPLRLFQVGRLDKYTSGLLFITNDGHFVQQVLQPHACIKEYTAIVLGVPTIQQIEALVDGIELSDGTARFESVKVLNTEVFSTRVKSGQKLGKRKRQRQKTVVTDKLTQYTCSTCSITCDSEKQYNIHMNGKKHHRRLANKQRSEKVPTKVYHRMKSRVKVCIKIGRNRIVRRLLASVGLPVVALHRNSIGKLVLKEGNDNNNSNNDSNDNTLVFDDDSSINNDSNNNTLFLDNNDSNNNTLVLDDEMNFCNERRENKFITLSQSEHFELSKTQVCDLWSSSGGYKMYKSHQVSMFIALLKKFDDENNKKSIDDKIQDISSENNTVIKKDLVKNEYLLESDVDQLRKWLSNNPK